MAETTTPTPPPANEEDTDSKKAAAEAAAKKTAAEAAAAKKAAAEEAAETAPIPAPPKGADFDTVAAMHQELLGKDPEAAAAFHKKHVLGFKATK